MTAVRQHLSLKGNDPSGGIYPRAMRRPLFVAVLEERIHLLRLTYVSIGRIDLLSSIPL
jgi:hypothetical protein